MNKDNEKYALILSNSGGGGHLSAATAVKTSLESIGYNVEITEIIKGIFWQEKISGTGENRFDSYFNQEKWFLLKLLVMCRFFADLILLLSKKRLIKNRILKKCNGTKLDLLVSVFPVGAACFQSVSRDLDVPFLIVPTDLKTDFFFSFMNKELNYNRVFAALPYDDPKVKKRLEEKNITVFTTDYPIRHEFELSAKKLRSEGNKNQKIIDLKNKYSLGEKDKSVLITIGAKGFAKESYLKYIKTINESIDQVIDRGEKFHIFAATGSSSDLYRSLFRLVGKLDLRIRLHVLNFMNAEEMSLHLKLVNTVISKPGGGIVAEAIASGVPLVMKSDSTQSLPWEKTNMNFVEKNKWGIALSTDKNEAEFRKDFLLKLMRILNTPSRGRLAPIMPSNDFSIKFSRLVSNIQNP